MAYILVRFLPTVTELVSGELIAGAKALVTVLTGERSLMQGNHQTNIGH